VALACGSQSTSSVLKDEMANAAERLMAVVVFPTPPFWLAMHIVCTIIIFAYHKNRSLKSIRNLNDFMKEGQSIFVA
jgi:hypothetical protein